MGACGGHDHSTQNESSTADSTSAGADVATDHSGHNMSNSDAAESMDDKNGMAEGIGHATGAVRSVDGEDGFLTIQHGPFSGGIDMGAMTMGFDIMGDVDLAGFKEGDNIAFMVKQGLDDGLRVMQICNTDTNGADCLKDTMKH